MEQLERWNNGLCREFAKAVNDIIKINKLSDDEYDLECIAQEVIRLHEEIFDENFSNDEKARDKFLEYFTK